MCTFCIACNILHLLHPSPLLFKGYLLLMVGHNRFLLMALACLMPLHNVDLSLCIIRYTYVHTYVGISAFWWMYSLSKGEIIVIGIVAVRGNVLFFVFFFFFFFLFKCSFFVNDMLCWAMMMFMIIHSFYCWLTLILWLRCVVVVSCTCSGRVASTRNKLFLSF